MNFSLGLVEVSALGNAIKMLDDMLKTADVEFVATERKLGGRLVTIVVKGELTGVKAAVDTGIETAKRLDCYKASNVIARPHEEILKFLHLDEENAKEANSEYAGTHVGAVNLPDHPKKAEQIEIEPPKTEVKEEKEEKAPEVKAPARNAAKRRGRPKKTK
jgi:microcompartment protein CcmL/EutN